MIPEFREEQNTQAIEMMNQEALEAMSFQQLELEIWERLSDEALLDFEAFYL